MLTDSALLGVSMSLSSGTKTALGEGASWIVAGAMVVATFVYYDELKFLFTPGSLHAANPQHVQTKPQTTQRTVTPQRAPVTQSAGYSVKLKAGRHGHYRTPARVNGREIQVLVDTGASYVALTNEDARRIGVFVTDADYKYKTQTANGSTRVAIVMLNEISIGDIEVRNVRATVHEPGKLGITLLGMSFLGKLRRTEMRGGELILEN